MYHKGRKINCIICRAHLLCCSENEESQELERRAGKKGKLSWTQKRKLNKTTSRERKYEKQVFKHVQTKHRYSAERCLKASCAKFPEPHLWALHYNKKQWRRCILPREMLLKWKTHSSVEARLSSTKAFIRGFWLCEGYGLLIACAFVPFHKKPKIILTLHRRSSSRWNSIEHERYACKNLLTTVNGQRFKTGSIYTI